MYSKDELCKKITDIYPEIGECGIDIDVRYDDEKKACEFAMKFEKDGYKYYEGMLSAAKDESLIKLLQFLVKEEDAHYDWIMKLYEYI